MIPSSLKRIIRQVQFHLRKRSSGLRTLPNFLIIGAQKGGTTSLYAYLAQHPNVAEALTKEVHYFDYHYSQGLSWYKAHFPLASRMKDKITGEATPYYLYHPHAASRVQQLLPNAKLIILLRDPVERAYSHYNMGNKFNKENRESFETAVSEEEGRIRNDWKKMVANPGWESTNVQNFSLVDRGDYLPQILRWEAHFPKTSMLFLKSEDFFQDPVAITKQAWKFLGLEAIELANPDTKNKGMYKSKLKPETRQQLEKYFEKKNQDLFKHLGKNFDW